MADYERIHDPNRQEHHVYRLIGKRGRILYIGCSMNLPVRLAEHRRNGRFGHLIERTESVGPFTYLDGRRLEREWIQVENPPFNTEWTTRDQRGVSYADQRSVA